VRHWIVFISSAFLMCALPVNAQLASAPAVPDNTLNSTNTIGLPPASSKEGTSEVINLNNGAVTLFLPAVTLPQRVGAAPLELGFTYDSNQINLQQNVTDVVQPDWETWGFCSGGGTGECRAYDSFYYSLTAVPIGLSWPLDLNIPELSASLEYNGDYQIVGQQGGVIDGGPFYCLMNFTFRDWKGTTHAFPYAIAACDVETGLYLSNNPTEVYTDNSNDNQFYHLDTTNRSDFVVYAPDGTAYHFANPNLPCGPGSGWAQDCPQGGSVEQFINMRMTSSVDRFGNTITFSTQTGNLTDTLGRTIKINAGPQEELSISYQDANGTQQEVSVVGTTGQIPQLTNGLPDVGPILASDCCNNPSTGLQVPNPQYYLTVEPTYNDPPAETSGRSYNGYEVHYTSTNQSYVLLFDYFYHLLKITYPEGGYHRYDYTPYRVLYSQGPIMGSWAVAEVSHRYECANSSGSCSAQQEAVTTYTPLASGLAGTPNGEMTVQDPDGATTVHRFGASMNSQIPGALTNLETDTYQYSSSGALLRYTHNDYAPVEQYNGGYSGTYTARPDLGAGYPFPIKVTTTLEDVNPALTSYTTISYDTVNLSTYGYIYPQMYIFDSHIDNPVATYHYGYDGTLNSTKLQSWYYLGFLANEPASVTTIDNVQNKQTTQAITHGVNGCITNMAISGTNIPSMSYIYTPDTWCRPISITDPYGNVTNYNYTDTNWANSSCAPNTNTYSYLTSVTNAKQQTTHFSYDSCTGHLGSSKDPNGVNVSLTYDGASRIVQRQVSSSAGLANYLTVAYQDGPGSTITRTELATPNPSTETQYTLDGLGRVIDQSVLSDPQGATHVTTTFNQQGEVQSVTNPYRSTSDPTYGITSYLYDALGRKTYQCQPDNGGANTANCTPLNSYLSYLQWSYSGNVVTSTDESMNQWRRTSDAFGRLTNVAELGSSSHPLNLQTNYTYDGFGNLLNVNQNGQSGDTPRQQRSFTYDALSRLVCASNSENSTAACPSSAGTYVAGTIGYNYYASGGALCAGDHSLPCSKTDARGVTTNYAYDSLNRLLLKTFTNAPAGSMSSCFAYDTATNGIGKLAAEWTQTGTCPGVAPASGGFQTMRIFQQYDAMGHVTNELQCTPNASGPSSCTTSNPKTFALNYGYDLAGNLAQYTNGIASILFTPQYNGAGRLSMLTSTSTWNDSLHPPTLFTADPTNGYTAAGGIQNMILGNSIFVTKTYDNRLRTTGETATHP